MIAAIVDDLLFGSKILAATDAAGEHVTFVRGAADPVTEAASAGASLVIVDLGRAGAAETIRELRRALGEAVSIVAFASHVRTDLIAAARQAGADRVLARSAFVAELPSLVRGSTPKPL